MTHRLLLRRSGVTPPPPPPPPPPPGTWVPPLGIPAPPFGITEVAPAVPTPWTEATSGFYYVDNASVAATDSANPNGWPATPRRTIPTDLAAGSVVEVHGGPYIYNTAGPAAFTASGTAAAPVFVRGVGLPVIQGPGTAPTYSDRAFLATGSYYVVEGFRFGNGTTLLVQLSGDHGVLRHSEVVDYQPPGYGAAVYGTGTHHVVYHNHIHHNGNYLSAIDNKVHGLKFGATASFIWLLNNEIHHNGGQSMQIGDDNEPNDAIWPHHIYIGFNDMYGDMEAAVAVKQARDVIISQNRGHDYLPFANGILSGDSHLGHTSMPTTFCVGRFGSHRVWVLFNTVHVGVAGIRSNGNIPDPPHPREADIYIIGNVISDIHSAAADPASAYSEGAGIAGWENLRVYVVDNTIVNADKGFSVTSTGYYEVTGNVCKGVGDPMSLVPINWGTNLFTRNFYDATGRLAYGTETPIVTLAQMQATGHELASGQGDAVLSAGFAPQAGSPLIGANTRSGVYDLFASLYGLDIATDITGRARPQDGAWTLGAYEYEEAI